MACFVGILTARFQRIFSYIRWGGIRTRQATVNRPAPRPLLRHTKACTQNGALGTNRTRRDGGNEVNDPKQTSVRVKACEAS